MKANSRQAMLSSSTSTSNAQERNRKSRMHLLLDKLHESIHSTTLPLAIVCTGPLATDQL